MIKSVISAFDILNCFVDGERRLSFNELNRLTGLSKSTLHSLLESLEEVRAVTRDPQTGQYALGYRLMQYAETARKVSIIDIAEPVMKRLRDDVGETVSLAKIDDWQQVIIATEQSASIVRVAPRVGVRSCMHFTAVGKAMLAHLSLEEVRHVVETAGMPRATRNTITMLEDLLPELDRVRKRGYSTDNMEHNDDIRCVGSAILGRDNRPVAGLSISGPAFRINEDDFELIGQRVRGAADEISYNIGGMKHQAGRDTAVSRNRETR